MQTLGERLTASPWSTPAEIGTIKPRRKNTAEMCSTDIVPRERVGSHLERKPDALHLCGLAEDRKGVVEQRTLAMAPVHDETRSPAERCWEDLRGMKTTRGSCKERVIQGFRVDTGLVAMESPAVDGSAQPLASPSLNPARLENEPTKERATNACKTLPPFSCSVLLALLLPMTCEPHGCPRQSS